MDDEVLQTWTLDPETRSALRIDRVRRCMHQGDWVEAVVECEELLDEEPDHRDALFLLAEAMLESGEPDGAVPVYERYLEQDPTHVPALSGLAVARLDICDIPGALAAAREAIRLAPDTAEAHFTLALALERVPGRGEEAAASFLAARQLAPDLYPLPLDLRPQDWERAVALAASRLPPELQQFWSRVPIRFEDLPTLEELQRDEPPIAPSVAGLYEGVPPEQADPWQVQPTAMRLYRRNLARCRSFEELVDRIAATLENEALDWLGPAADPQP